MLQWCSGECCAAVQCSAVQCSAVHCSAVQCSAVQCSAEYRNDCVYSAAQLMKVQYCGSQKWSSLFSEVFCKALRWTAASTGLSWDWKQMIYYLSMLGIHPEVLVVVLVALFGWFEWSTQKNTPVIDWKCWFLHSLPLGGLKWVNKYLTIYHLG